MNVTSFWGAKATETSSIVLTVPADTTFSLNQLTLAGACDSTTTVWVKSVFVGEGSDDFGSDEDRESIESDSEDDADLSTSTIAIGHLKWGGQDSLRTDLVFGEGEKVKFTVVGDGEVHFAGNLVVIQAMPADSDEDDDEDYAVAEAGQLRLLGGLDSSEDEEDEEYVEVDSDEGETIYLNDESNGMDEDEMDSDDSDSEVDGDFIVNPDDLSDSENDAIVVIDPDTDDSSDDEDGEIMIADPKAYRRLLLGEDAGDRPDSDDDDDDLDDEALYAAMAADDDSADGELADEADFVATSSKNKKRARAGSFDGEFASPNNKRSKHREQANGHSHSHHKHGGRHGGKRHGGGRF